RNDQRGLQRSRRHHGRTGGRERGGRPVAGRARRPGGDRALRRSHRGRSGLDRRWGGRVSIYRGPYYGATGCDSGPKPGTNALVSWFLGAYASRGAANLGTYACKRLGSGWSIHAERRAADLGTAPYGRVDSDWGWNLANALRLNSSELGIQCIILGRRIWSCVQPDAGWRPYSGQYHGHAHVELTPSAAQSLTAATIQSLIGGSGGPTT